MAYEFGFDEVEDIALFGLKTQFGDAPVGVTTGGDVFVSAELHPLGAAKALALCDVMHIPFVNYNAVTVLVPADWIKAETLHDSDRQRVIENIESLIRRGGV